MTTPQAVTEPLTSDAIFLVVTVNRDDESRDVVRAAVRRPSPGSCAPSRRATRADGSRASSASGRRRGTVCSERRGRRSCTCCPRSPPAGASPSRRRATCSSTSAPSGWTSASSWRCRSCRRLHGRGLAGGRGARLPLLRRPRPARLRRRHREPGRRGGGRRDDRRRRGSGVRRRQLRDRAEVRARPRQVERAADRGAGADHRPHQARRHRARRRREADQRAQRADGDRRGRRGDRHPPRATCRSATVTDGEFGTYFIGYARSPRVLEQMLENMFVGGRPATTTGCSTSPQPVTGTNFFAPAATFLEAIGADA